MEVVSDILVVLLLLSNLYLLAASRITACIQTVALQAVVLGVIALTSAAGGLTLVVVSVTLATMAVKGLVLPWLLRRAIRGADVAREVEPFVGFTTSVLVGAGLLVISVVVAEPLCSSAPADVSAMMIPTSLFTILTGLFIVVTRRKALNQALGYLVLENGVYVFGSSLAIEEPFLVELGILLDVFVAVFVMGIIIFQINREFDHIDTDKLSVLKD